MRKIKEVLRLRFELGLGQRAITRSCGMGLGTVHNYLERAAAAGMGWPLPEGLSEEELEGKLLGNQPMPARALEARPQPDWKEILEQLQRHRHLTLQRKRHTTRLMTQVAKKHGISRASTNPLDRSLDSDLRWAVRWLIEVPDVHGAVCTSVLGDFMKEKKYKYSSEIATQLSLSGAAFTIENPSTAADRIAQYNAGVLGALTAYQSIFEANAGRSFEGSTSYSKSRPTGH